VPVGSARDPRLCRCQRVRTETASIPSVSMHPWRGRPGEKKSSAIFKVSMCTGRAGKMSELLPPPQCPRLRLDLRRQPTYDRALSLAYKFKGQASHFEDCTRPASAPTSSSPPRVRPHAIFARTRELFLSRRKNRPMFFIDIASPPHVESRNEQADGIFVYDTTTCSKRWPATSPIAARKPSVPSDRHRGGRTLPRPHPDAHVVLTISLFRTTSNHPPG